MAHIVWIWETRVWVSRFVYKSAKEAGLGFRV